MGAPAAAGGVFLALAWCSILALPYSWHKVHGIGLKNYDVGLYKYEVTKGTAGHIASFAAGALEKAGGVDEEKKKKMEGIIGEGTYWLTEVEKDNCTPVVGDLIGFLRDWCNMWRRMQISSYILAGCIVTGSLLALISAGLNFNTTKQSHGARKTRKVTGILGPVIGLLGLATYFFMTRDFPDPGGSSNELTVGAAFWSALVLGVLLLLTSAITTCMDNDVSGADGENMQSQAWDGAVQQQWAVGHVQEPPHGAMPQPQSSHGAVQPGMPPGSYGTMQQVGMPPGSCGATPGPAPPYFEGSIQLPGSMQLGYGAMRPSSPAPLSPRDQAMMAMRPQPLPPPSMNTGLNPLPPPGAMPGSMQLPGSIGLIDPTRSRTCTDSGEVTFKLSPRTGIESRTGTESQPPMPWGFAAPPVRSASPALQSPRLESNIPGLQKSHPFDR